MTEQGVLSNSTIVFLIGVEGILEPKWNGYFGDFQICPGGSDWTLLCGRTEDQSAVLGALARLHGLGLTISCLVRASCPSPNQNTLPDLQDALIQRCSEVHKLSLSCLSAIFSGDGGVNSEGSDSLR